MANIPQPLSGQRYPRPTAKELLLNALIEGLTHAGEQYVTKRLAPQDPAQIALGGQQQGAMQNLNAAAQQPMGLPGAGVPDTSAQAQTALNQLSMIRAHSKNDASMLAAAPSMAAPIMAERSAQARNAESVTGTEALQQQKQAQYEALRDQAIQGLPTEQQATARSFLDLTRQGLNGAVLKLLYGDKLPPTAAEAAHTKLEGLQYEDLKARMARTVREEAGIRKVALANGLDPDTTTTEDVRRIIAAKSPDDYYSAIYTKLVSEPHMNAQGVPVYMDPQAAHLRAERAVQDNGNFGQWHAGADASREAIGKAELANGIGAQMSANPTASAASVKAALAPQWFKSYQPDIDAGIYSVNPADPKNPGALPSSPNYDAMFNSAWQIAQDRIARQSGSR